MTHLMRFELRVSPRVAAGIVSALLHLGLLLLLAFSSGRFDGFHEAETSLTSLVMLDTPRADRRDGVHTPPQALPPAPAPDPEPSREDDVEQSLPIREPTESIESTELAAAAAISAPEIPASTTASDTAITESLATFVSPSPEQAALLANLARLAEELAQAPTAQVTWQEAGKQYRAALVRQPASTGLEFDRVVAEVSAEDHGRQFRTHIRLKRLAFSHYTQMIDRWDPMVHLHDDEIVGRFHVNSQFNLLYDRSATPVFLGKVTTAASGFTTQAGAKRREADIFRGGIETKVGRIALPEQLQPFEWAPREADVRIHEFGSDTRIRFFADGSYAWQGRNANDSGYRNEPSAQPVYFIASRTATLYVQGIVSGKVLVYSPQRIVVEGSLKYAHDPRDSADSDDYLGLVSDRTIEVAGAHVTGPGDIDIQAALFARRRFLVRDIDHPRPATLRIYGSLAAGSVSASEPRYATRIEYDSRFEQQRPPGFPSTNRFAAEDWDGLWTEAAEQTVAGEF
ncbi:hypothetical protein [Povalibacter sp.]|uniref:hypothetical protein n=1 Tax=Povalibacter sp. TaxID=1962978 RepID=UPI002F3FDDBE